MNKPNTQVASCETWRRYGVMVHDTTDTLGGMHRIEIKPDRGAMIPCGPAVAFTFTQEQADRIVKAVNCHDDLLSACKMAFTMMKEQQMANAKRGEPVLVGIGMAMQACDKAIDRATTQKAGTK